MLGIASGGGGSGFDVGVVGLAIGDQTAGGKHHLGGFGSGELTAMIWKRSACTING